MWGCLSGQALRFGRFVGSRRIGPRPAGAGSLIPLFPERIHMDELDPQNPHQFRCCSGMQQHQGGVFICKAGQVLDETGALIGSLVWNALLLSFRDLTLGTGLCFRCRM